MVNAVCKFVEYLPCTTAESPANAIFYTATLYNKQSSLIRQHQNDSYFLALRQNNEGLQLDLDSISLHPT